MFPRNLSLLCFKWLREEMSKDDDLDVLIPSLSVLVVLLLLLLLFCYHKGYLRRCFCWVFNYRGGRFDLREPLLPFIFTSKRRDLLIKRCDQSSTNEIENRVITRLKQNVHFDERQWERAQDDEFKPVFVFCVISSRIGTDIENAMRGVNVNSRVILVMLHCILKSQLRGDLSDDEDLLDSTLRNRMTGIAHFAFSDREGLYKCRQNDVGFDKLIDIVHSLPKPLD